MRKMDWRVLRPRPEVCLAQAKRSANIALQHYNKRRKVKFELLKAMRSISVPEPRCCYTHVNFTAKSSKEGSQEQLFFAELYYRKGRQIVICCEPLDPDSVVGHKFLKRDGTSAVRKKTDLNYCFACPETMLHPKGEKFIAEHYIAPHVYNGLR